MKTSSWPTALLVCVLSLVSIGQATTSAGEYVEPGKGRSAWFKKGEWVIHGKDLVDDGKVNGAVLLNLLHSKDVEDKQSALSAINMLGGMRDHATRKDWMSLRDAVIELMYHSDRGVRQSAILTAQRFWQDDQDRKIAKAMIYNLDSDDDATVAFSIQGFPNALDYVLGSDHILGTLKGLVYDKQRPMAQHEAIKFFFYLADTYKQRSPSVKAKGSQAE